ncbi:MAG TPA: serine hydrolase [Thermomicrobiales bacterium]|nr:serine hydrolase [Thermomicrobiales bacterium]
MPTDHTATWNRIRKIVDDRPAGTLVSVTAYDAGSGEAFEIEGEHNYASASTIKILILVALARAFDEGRLKPTDKRPARQEIRLTGSGVVNWLDPDLELTLQDHAWLMTAISDNTTSNVLIDTLGVDAINEVGTDLGTGGTRLGRMFMDRNIPPGPPQNRATSNGLVAILKAIENDTAASPEQCAWMRKCLDDQQYRNDLARHLPDDVHYRGKGGSIEGIEHDCGVLTGPKGKVIVAVMTQGFENSYDADRIIGRIGTAIADGLTA